ncbi:TPA: hypothetical protein DCQ44_00885, partial [Candidatus Taylorbacteria bacterium]|nr:hypothetical protein [Candidatus Taylorbacteria bacterium]
TAEKRQVKDLRAWLKNPRRISTENFSKLKERITRRGFHDVIKIDKDGTVLSGNQRRRALIDLGINEVIVLIPNRPLTKDERDKVALESNISDGSWNFDELKSFKLDTLTDIGFNKNELMDIWDENLEVQDGLWDEEAEIRKATKTKIKRGDIFSLGKHRLICSDSLDPTTVKKLMGSTRVDLIDIDMPYNISLSYDKGVGGKRSFGGTTKDNKTDEEYRVFAKTIIQNALLVAQSDCHAILWCDERYVWLFQTLFKELGIDSKRLLVWAKNNASPTPTVAFNKAAEFAVYGTVGSPYLSKSVTNLSEFTNKNLTSGNNLSQELLDQMSILVVKRVPSNKMDHPTEKSPSLHEKALRRCTKVGDAVLDLTAGSGSIMSACEQLKRVAYMCEYEPVFCQVILNRYKKLTGLNPIQINEKA